jgi:hypothetical protein
LSEDMLFALREIINEKRVFTRSPITRIPV